MGGGAGGGGGGGGVCDCGEGEFYVCDFGGRAEPRAITEGAGRCGRLRIAPDGTGVAYLATHGSGTCLGLWWVPWEGGVPPQPLTPPHAPILHFGWAPSEEVDESEPEEVSDSDASQAQEPHNTFGRYRLADDALHYVFSNFRLERIFEIVF